MTLIRTARRAHDSSHAPAHATRVRGTAIAVVAFALGACAYPLEMLGAQQAPPVVPASGTTPAMPGTPPPASPLAPYRAPAIALVQPLPGGTVAQDRAAVVIRFAQGEPDDPVDIASFAVTVDGADRTREFQVTSGQAWGTLGSADPATRLSIGTHQVAMRICSSRNACATAEGSIAVLPPMTGETPVAGSTAPPANKVKRALGALVSVGRKLLGP